MAIKVSAKALKAEYGLMIIGLPYNYCNLIKDLMNWESPEFYTCGVYGWNCDAYLVKMFGKYPVYLISMGYRPIGECTEGQKNILELYEKQFITRDECLARLYNSLKSIDKTNAKEG